MFWGTVVDPGGRVVITAPPNVSQLRITRALPYDLAPSLAPRNRLFLQTHQAPPILICYNTERSSDDGCKLDITLSRSDLDRSPVLYETRDDFSWALTGVAEEDATSVVNQQDEPWVKSAVQTGILGLTVSLIVLVTVGTMVIVK